MYFKMLQRTAEKIKKDRMLPLGISLDHHDAGRCSGTEPLFMLILENGLTRLEAQ